MIEGGINDAILHVELFNIVLCQRFDTRITDFAGFELNIDHDVIVTEQGECFAQGRNMFTIGESHPLELCAGQICDPAAAISCTVDAFIMHHDKMTISAHLNIGFNPIDAMFTGVFKAL